MDSIDKHLCPGSMGERAEIVDGVDCAGEVGGGAEGNQTSLVGKLALEVINIEGAIIRMDGNFADGYARITRSKFPWRKIAVMIEAGDKNFIAGLPGFGQCPAKSEGQRGHVRAEANRVRIICAQKVRRGLMGVFKHRIALITGGKFALVVCIAVCQIIANGINDTLRNLAARRAIKERHGLAINFA